MFTNDYVKCKNQLMVEKMMARMHAHPVGVLMQELPTAPTAPRAEICKLRARLLLEETLETIQAMGLDVTISDLRNPGEPIGFSDMKQVNMVEKRVVDVEEVYDGLCDIAVVNYGAAAAFGLALQPGFELCMANNLLKFAPGHSFNEHGKLIKPPNHPKLRLATLLLEHGFPQ